MPSRLLTSEDEFFKQLVYRGAVRARAMREGFQAGLWRDPANPNAFSDYVARALDNAATATGTGNDPMALQMARYATFQNSLEAQTNTGMRTIGETINGVSTSHPGLKLILPFVRTPTNMLRFVWDRTPGLNLARGQFRNDLMGTNGPAAQSQALARHLTGATLWATAITYAADGTITGGGPADKEGQKNLRATGWQPYSVRVQNEDGSTRYDSFDRLNPFASFFTIAADFAEVAVAHPERTIEQTAGSMMVALARNIENASYLSGLLRAAAALAAPDRSAEGFAKGVAGGFVPSFMKQTIMGDDTMRETRGIVDALRARTPGYSTQLDPQRNILGAEVHQAPSWGPDWLSPIAETGHPGGAQPVSYDWRHTVQTRPEDELARLMYNHGSAITPPPHNIGQYDLTQVRSAVTGKTAYDRMQELTGTVEIGGMNLRDRIADTIKKGYYKDTATDGDSADEGSRLNIMTKLVGAYRDMAKKALGDEQPEIAAGILAEHIRKGRTLYQ